MRHGDGKSLHPGRVTEPFGLAIMSAFTEAKTVSVTHEGGAFSGRFFRLDEASPIGRQPGSGERNENAMAPGIPLPRASLDGLFSGGRLKRFQAHMPHFWCGVLEGLDFRTLEGASEYGSLRFRYANSLVRFDADSIVLINDRTGRRTYSQAIPGETVSMIEWGQVYSRDGHISIASVPGENGPEVLLYADHEEAPLLLHERLDRLRLGFRRGVKRQRRACPRAATALAMSVMVLAMAGMVEFREKQHRHHEHHLQMISVLGGLRVPGRRSIGIGA
jgi:hypothetical protein